MAPPSVMPKILAVLEPFLERAERDWLAQPEAGRQSTLPLTNDGKVNVTQLVKVLGLSPSYAQHFYKEAIAGVVNAVARAQGVKPIRNRAMDDAEDDAAKAKIAQLSAETKRQTEGHSLSRVRLAELERENTELRARVARAEKRLEHLQQNGSLIRTAEIVE
jgi:hypothetical protein